MVYQYRGIETIEAEEARERREEAEALAHAARKQQLLERQRIEDRELARAEKRLKELQALEAEAIQQRLRRAQIAEALRTPTSIYGGREGLEAAAKEGATWNQSHRRGTWAA